MIDFDTPMARFARWYSTVALRCMGTGAVTMATGRMFFNDGLDQIGTAILLVSTLLALVAMTVIGWMEE